MSSTLLSLSLRHKKQNELNVHQIKRERERESEVVFRGGRDVILGCRCCKSSPRISAGANNTITMQHGNPFPLLSLQPANTWTGDSDAQIWQPYSIFPPNSTVSVFIKKGGMASKTWQPNPPLSKTWFSCIKNWVLKKGDVMPPPWSGSRYIKSVWLERD